MATWKLAVITSVERLWPHDDPSKTFFVFGLNLQTAMVGTASLNPVDFKRLEPWQWHSLDGVDLWGSIQGGPNKPFLLDGATATIMPMPSTAPAVQVANAITSISNRRNTMQTLNGSVPFVWSPGETQPPTPPPLGNYHHLMGSIGLTAGVLGQALNLTAVFQVQASQIDPSFPVAADGSFPSGLQLFGAPRFTANDATTQYKPMSSAPAPVSNTQYPVSNSQYFEWAYVDPTGSNSASAYSIGVALDPGIPDPTTAAGMVPTEFFNLHTYWVRKQVPSGVDATGKLIFTAAIDPGKSDWHIRLADGIADAWNLPRHLLDAAKVWAALPAQDFGLLWQAILASLRDRAGMGLLAAPDGDSLVSLALKRNQLPTTDIVTLNWIERLRVQDRMTSLQSWQQQVTAALKISPASLPAVPPAQTAQVEATWMAPFPAVSGGTIKASLQRADTQDPGSNWTDVSGLVDQVVPMVRVGAGQTTAFKLSLVSKAVTPGWYRGRSTDGMGNTVFTGATYISTPLTDALAPLAGASASLQKDDALSGMVGSLWQQASTLPMTLPVNSRSARSFMAVQLPTVPDSTAKWSEEGALSLDNGAGWAVTMANVSLALPHDPQLSITTWLPQVVTVWLPQVVKVTGTTGSYSLTLGSGGPSISMNLADSADAMQSKLEPLVGGKGMVTVVPSTVNGANLFTIKFANPDIQQIVAAGTAGDTVATTYNLATLMGTGRTFQLGVKNQRIASLPFNAAAADVQSALENLTSVGAGRVAVAMAADQTGTITKYTIVLADQTQPTIAAVVATNTDNPGFGISAAVSTLVSVSITAGTFTLRVEAQTSVVLPFNATISQVQDALQDLAGVGKASASATKDIHGNPAYSINFTSPGLPQVVATGAGGVNASALMLLSVSGTAGNFKLRVGPQTTATPIKFNATAADIQTALEGLSNVGAGKVHVNPYAIGLGVFSIAFDDDSLPQVVAAGAGGTTATVSTLVSVIPPQGQFTMKVGTPSSAAMQTTDPLSFGAKNTDVQAAISAALAKVTPAINSGVTVAAINDPSGTTVYTITFADQTVTLTAAGSGSVQAAALTFWGNYEIVAESIPSVTQAKAFLRISAGLEGNAGQPSTNQLTLAVSSPTFLGTGPLTQCVSVPSGKTSHSLRTKFLPANALVVHVGGTSGQFTLKSGAQSATLNTGAFAPAVQTAVVNITGFNAAQVSVTASTQTDNSIVYVVTFGIAVPSITGTETGGATISVSGVVEITIFCTFATPTAAHTDWTQVTFGTQRILVPVDQVPHSAIVVRHGLANTPNPLGGSELLQLVPPVYFTSPAATFDTDLGTQWDSLPKAGGPAPVDRTRAFWQANSSALTAAISFASPRRRLALGQTGRLWPVWNFDDKTVSNLRSYIEIQIAGDPGDASKPGYLAQLADQRFGWPTAALTSGPYLDFTQDFPNNLPAASADLQSAIEGYLHDYVNHVIRLKHLLPPDADRQPATGILPQEQNADLVPTTKPHAFSFQVDRFDVETTTPVIGDDDDLMTRLAGVGVLLRQAVANPPTPSNPFIGQPWRMLNMADLSAPDTTTPGLNDSGTKPVASGVVAPARLHHQDGARQNLITYDNQYLLAQSPLADVAKAKGFQDQLAFTLAVECTSGSFDLVLTPSGPHGPQHITLDANGQLNTTIDAAVKALLSDANNGGQSSVTSVAGANGTTLYTIYMLVGRPVPLLSVANVSPATVTAQMLGSTDDDTNTTVFRYDSPSLTSPAPGAAWGTVPSLKFGQMFEAQAFIIGNCGAMPKELAPVHPLVLQAGPVTTAPDENVVRRLRYLRRVGVGTPRLAPGADLTALGEAAMDGNTAPSGLPTLPAGLQPLAKELGLHVLSANLPNERFFFDTSGRVGQLNPGSQWTLTLPRVVLTGSAPQVDTDANPPANWQIRFGFQATDALGNILGQFSMLVVRTGATLTLTLDQVIQAELPVAGSSPITLTTRVQVVVVQGAAGTYSLTYPGPSGTLSTGPLAFTPPAQDAWEPADATTEVNPLQTALCVAAQLGAGNVVVNGIHSGGACIYTITPAGSLAAQTLLPLSGAGTATVAPSSLLGGPIDLQLRRNGGTLSFCWRRSDRDEPWICPPVPVWNLTAADQALDTTRCFIQVSTGDPTLAPTFGIPSVTTSSSASGSDELTPPPENEPITVLTPPFVNGVSTVDGGEMTFAIRPPAVDLQTWARWYDMDLYLGASGASSAIRTSIWIAYQALLPVDDPTHHNQGLDLSFDDPAVCGLLFELVQLLVEPTSQYLTITGTEGSFTLSVGGSITNPLPASNLDTPDGQKQLLDAIQSELQDLPTIGTNSVVVTLLAQTGSTVYAIAPSGALAGEPLPVIQAAAQPGLTVGVQSSQPLKPIQKYCPIIKAQIVTVRGTTGTFALTLNGQTTAAIPFNASPQVVQSLVGSLAGIGSTNVSVTSWQSDNNTTNYSMSGTGAFAVIGLPAIQAGPTTGDVTVVLRAGHAQSGLPYYVQTAPFVVKVKSTTHTPRLDWDGDRIVTLRVGEQEIWELRVYPTVSKTYFTASDVPGAQRFHTLFGTCATPNKDAAASSLGTPGDRVDPGASTPYYLFTPWRLTIEVATEQVMLLGPLVMGPQGQSPYLPLPTSTTPPTPLPDLRLQLVQALAWQAVQPSFDGRSVNVTFDKLAPALISNPQQDATGSTTAPNLAANSIPGDPRRYRYATTIQLQRQVWRWEGRPVPELPFEAAGFVEPPAGLAMDPSQGPDQMPIDTVPSGCDTNIGVDFYSAVQNLQLWDAAGFGDRTGVDLLGQTTNVGYGTASSTLFTENLTGDPRALYYRFNPELFSRYASLFSPFPPFLTAAGYDPFAHSSTNPAAGSVTPWRRLIVPCRWTGDVPRPVVRFIVPLTQPDDSSDADPVQETGTTTSGGKVVTGISTTSGLSIGMAVTASSFPAGTTIQSIDSGTQVTVSVAASANGANLLTFSVNNAAQTPGLLVVLDETVLTTGGLAETIEADVVRIDDTYNGQAAQSRPEFGPDPTLTARGWTKGAADHFAAPDQAVAMNVVGPLGHTFDTAAAPLFVTSSYFVHPPQMDTNPIKDPSLAWYFIKARFRRLLVPEGQLGYLPLKPDNVLTAASGTLTTTLDDPPLASGQNWVISIADVQLPVSTPGTLALGIMVANRTTPFCTLTVTSTPPGASGMPGTLTLGLDSPFASANYHWDGAPQSVDLDLRLVFQQDVSTQPEGPIEVSVKGPALGTFTLTYNGRTTSPAFPVGTTGSAVETELTAIGALVSVNSAPDPQDPATTIYTIDVEDNSNPLIVATGSAGVTVSVAKSVQPPTLHFTVSYRIRTATANSTANLWQTLQSAQWTNQDGTWPTSVTATASGGPVHVRSPRSLPALVSPFTAPYWVQFLANTQRLVPADARSYQITWIQTATPTTPQFKLVDQQGNAGTWNLGPTVLQQVEAGSDVAFARILLLTQVVRDVTGNLGPERYLGLYYLNSGGTFSCQHRSPALPANTSEEQTIGQVSVRVVDVQVRATPVDPTTGNAAYQFPRPDFWADIFGDPKNVDPQGASDALSRIVGVSAPVSLKVTNAQMQLPDLINRRAVQTDRFSKRGR